MHGPDSSKNQPTFELRMSLSCLKERAKIGLGQDDFSCSHKAQHHHSLLFIHLTCFHNDKLN